MLKLKLEVKLLVAYGFNSSLQSDFYKEDLPPWVLSGCIFVATSKFDYKEFERSSVDI